MVRLPNDRAALDALAALVNVARALPLDRSDLVQAFTLGLLTAGIENPQTLRRCLTIAGVAEGLWCQATAPAVEGLPRAAGGAA